MDTYNPRLDTFGCTASANGACGLGALAAARIAHALATCFDLIDQEAEWVCCQRFTC